MSNMKLKKKLQKSKHFKKKEYVNGHVRIYNKYLILFLIVFIIFGMGCSYALISRKLNIGEESQNNQVLKIIDISVDSQTAGALNLYDPTFYDMTLSFNLCLSDIDDYIIYSVTIKNNTLIDKVLNNISIDNINNSDITYTVENISINDVVKANTGTSFKIKIKYRNDITEVSNTCVGMSINLNFVDS